MSSNVLQCPAPVISQTVSMNGEILEVNYTLIMDNAAGPNITGELKLFLKPNPIFYHFNTTQHYVPASLLQLLVSDTLLHL